MEPPKLFNALLSEFGPEDRAKHVSFFIDCLDYNKRLSLYNTKDLKPLISFVNSSLSDPNARIDGLNILNVIIEQCSTETFSEQHVQWIEGLKKIITTDSSTEVRILAADILNRIFTHASIFPEFVRNLSTSVVPQFLQSITASFSDDEHCLASVKLIGSFLKFFPGSCRQNITVLKKKILVLLFSDNRDVVELSAASFAMFPYVGAFGGAKMDREANWTKFYAQLLGSVHQVLNKLYEKVETQDKKVDPDEQVQFDFKEIVGDPARVHLLLCRRSIGFLITLQKMLTTDGRDPRLFVTVPIEDTLSLACRIFNVNGHVVVDSVHRNQSQMLVLMSFIPILHQETIRVLIHLLLMCRRHMSLHGTSILQIVQQALHWTTPIYQVVEFGHPMANLRVSIYELFVTWLETAHSPSGLKNVELSLINRMLCDVVPQTQSVLLDPGSGDSKTEGSKSKKVKRDFGSISSVDVIHRKSQPWANSELCEAALKALKTLFYLGAEDLHVRSLNDVHSAVLKLAFDVQTLVDIPNPYKDPKCRSALYKLLLATVIPQHPRYVPELSTSIEIFSKGVMDRSSEVSEACIESLAVCQMMTNPRRRPMNHLASYSVADEVTVDSDYELDERNPTADSVTMEVDEDKEVKPVEENGFHSDHEESAKEVIVNGGAVTSEEFKEVVDADEGDDIQEVDSPVQVDDCFSDEPQIFDETTDVEIDRDEPEIIEIHISNTVAFASNEKSAMSPVIGASPLKRLDENSKGAEEMLTTFVDAQPDVD